MNTRDLMNQALYPSVADNIRRKDYPLYDTLAIATGQLEYYFFTTAPGNQFLRNKRLPLSGTEVYFVDEISMYLQLNLTTVALVNAFNELMQQSFLQISVDGRVQCKLPGLDILNYMTTNVYTATGTALDPQLVKIDRRLPIPIMLNSTSSFEVKFVTTSAAATAFNTNLLRLVFHGTQLDKLDSFYWDNLKQNQFQQVPVTYYNTVVIGGATETTYPLFNNLGTAPNLISQTFPLSDIQTFQLQNLEVYFNQPDTPIEPTTIFNSRIQNILRINIDDVDYFNASVQEFASLLAMFSTSLTTTPDTVVLDTLSIRQSKTLRVPLNIPANSKVVVTITQPASSLGITGEITVCMRGVETRRVA
jgi:hypothetical protein